MSSWCSGNVLPIQDICSIIFMAGTACGGVGGDGQWNKQTSNTKSLRIVVLSELCPVSSVSIEILAVRPVCPQMLPDSKNAFCYPESTKIIPVSPESTEIMLLSTESTEMLPVSPISTEKLPVMLPVTFVLLCPVSHKSFDMRQGPALSLCSHPALSSCKVPSLSLFQVPALSSWTTHPGYVGPFELGLKVYFAVPQAPIHFCYGNELKTNLKVDSTELNP